MFNYVMRKITKMRMSGKTVHGAYHMIVLFLLLYMMAGLLDGWMVAVFIR